MIILELGILEGLLRILEAFSLTRHVTRWLRPRLRYRLTLLSGKLMRGHIEYYPVQCDSARLEQVLALGNHFYEHSTGVEAYSIRDLNVHNPEIITPIVAFNRETAAEAVVGYFALLPLTKQGMEAVQAGRIEGSRHLRPDDLCHTFRRFAGLYVSAVYGVDRLARIETTNWLLTKILDEKDRKPALKLVFARPTTPEGAAIFESLTSRRPALGEIQIIDLDDNEIMRRYLKRAVRVRKVGRRRRERRES